jgi:hypothetical protein
MEAEAMTRTKLSILLIFFTALTVASITTVYYTHQIPTEEKSTTTLGFYRHTGQYDYTAKLKPNIIYNKSTLKPSQGTLYTKIVDHINVTFTYTFTCSHQTNITSIAYETETVLETEENWNKTFTKSEMLDTFQPANTVNSTEQKASTTLFVNITEIEEIIKAVDEQIGTSTAQYSLKFKPIIDIIAEITLTEADTRTIHESFAHKLTIESRKGTPNYISVENLEQTRQDTIDQTQITPLIWVTNQRNASCAFSAIASSALAITGAIYIKTEPASQPEHKEKTLKKILKEHKELIAETKEEPPLKQDTTTIKMATMEDLAKISETLMKPILYTKKTPKPPKTENSHIFYIIDNNTKYQFKYRTTAPTKT